MTRSERGEARNQNGARLSQPQQSRWNVTRNVLLYLRSLRLGQPRFGKIFA